MNRAASWTARVALLTVSLGIVIVCGEFVVARLAPQDLSIWDSLRDGLTVHRVHADVYLPGVDQRIQTNNLGMRDRERMIEKPEDTFRLLVLGDSFMEALQVPIEESFPALLEERIEDPSSTVEVVNLSVSGWGTDDEVTYLERHGLSLSPDGILIMMTLHNDVSDNLMFEFHTMDPSGLRARPVSAMPLPRYAIQKLKAYLAGSSQIYQLAYQTSVRGRVRRGAVQLDRHVASLLRRDSSPEVERGWKVTLALLDKAASLIERNGAWLAIGMIPLRVQVEDAAYLKFLDTHGLSADLMQRDAPQRRLDAWARSRGIPIVDLLPAFEARAGESNEILYLPVDGHWSAAGHALAAREIATALARADLGLVAAR